MFKKWMAISLCLISTVPLAGNCDAKCSIFDLCDPYEGWGVYADWVYWRARKCDLRYAIPYQNDAEAYGKGHTLSIDPDFSTGYRIGLTKSCESFDLAATYSYFNDKEKKNKKSDAGSLAPSRLMAAFAQTNGTNLQYAESEYEIDYHVIDLELGYHFTVSCERKIHYFSGIKVAQIDQKLNTFYSRVQSNFGSNHYDKVSETVDTQAIGVYAGMDGTWDIGCGFGISGRVSIATLGAEFDLSNQQRSYDAEAHRLINHVKEHCHSLIFNTEFRSALEYRLEQCRCMNWTFSIGYEYHTWIGMEGFLQLKQENEETAIPLIDRHTETLGFDGIFLRANVDF